jgi:TfoX/Sxy family transcriptional regulator of competence genes
MATQQSTIDFLTDQIKDAGVIRSRKMFGEYALYCDEKVVAFVCDDQLFMKHSEADGPFRKFCVETPAYPGSKDYLRVDQEKWDDHEWLTQFVRATAAALPEKGKK